MHLMPTLMSTRVIVDVDCECWLQVSLKEPRSEPAMTHLGRAQPYEKPLWLWNRPVYPAVQHILLHGAETARPTDASRLIYLWFFMFLLISLDFS